MPLLAKLREPANIPTETPRQSQPAVSMFGEAHFKQAVLKAKHYITEGDLMQVVLSQRMSKPFTASPLALYRSLRSLNPSPYMFYFNLEDFYVVGASPEILVRLEGDTVTVRPIAGTRKRGTSFEEDQALAAELLAASEGLGFMIQQGRRLARPDVIIVGMLAIGFLGALMSWILTQVEARFASSRRLS